MSRVDEYLQATERKNTLLSYASGIRRFEIEWKGLLPGRLRGLPDPKHASPEAGGPIALARGPGIRRSHQVAQGQASPQRHPGGVHTAENRARPLELEVLETVDQWLAQRINEAQSQGDTAAQLRFTRDRSLVLLGFWRGFRSNELARLSVENVQIVATEGLTCYLEACSGGNVRQANAW